jgi:integrase/recombinase XerD
VREAYETHISEFRKVLHEHGHDLDCEDENTISSLIQEWAVSSKGEKKDVSPHTFNQRLSTIRSFYRFALKQLWIMKNPIEMIERREEPVSNVEPLDLQVVQDGFRLIDRSTLLGKRDYALFCVLFTTERLVSEVTELQCGDITKGDSGVTLTFQRVKGGKRIRQNLTSATASVLLDYLNTVYGNEWPNDAPVWISDSRFNKGDAIGTQAVNGRCEKYFGTSKLEVIRRTAAEMRKRIGAKDIENMLQIN